MREGAKRRLAGAVVIVALAVIFVPMLFEEDSLAPSVDRTTIPDEPDLGDRFGVAPPLPLLPEDGQMPDEALTVDLAPSEQGGTDPTAGGSGQLAEGTPEPVRPKPQPEPPRTTQSSPKPAPAVRSASSPQTQKPAAPIAPPPRGPSDGMPSWVVQVASLGAVETAQGLAGKLKKSGFSAFVERAEVRGKTYYRVRVGPELDRANAERTAAMLRQQEKLDTLIQRYPSN
ncbi:SPOR domain-containing protein [Imhoffiella purpurea]|uniref:DedD protein n=1 Tax=Imhoffiella purpurea TaxID=1249627 RepID=W9VW48_9GAMM|nr:SPOR domain-containing protein [Imhoffiella purpurea]EXJ14685.1 DedD protein [Imhoffiella purpurea]